VLEASLFNTMRLDSCTAIERAKERGCHIIQLTTDKKRVDALRFYERLAFKATHEDLKKKL